MPGLTPSFLSCQVIPYLLVRPRQVHLVMLSHQDVLYPKQAQLYHCLRYYYLVIITEAICKNLGVQLTAPIPVTVADVALQTQKRKPSREIVVIYIDSIILLTWQEKTLIKKHCLKNTLLFECPYLTGW